MWEWARWISLTGCLEIVPPGLIINWRVSPITIDQYVPLLTFTIKKIPSAPLVGMQQHNLLSCTAFHPSVCNARGEMHCRSSQQLYPHHILQHSGTICLSWWDIMWKLPVPINTPWFTFSASGPLQQIFVRYRAPSKDGAVTYLLSKIERCIRSARACTKIPLWERLLSVCSLQWALLIPRWGVPHSWVNCLAIARKKSDTL